MDHRQLRIETVVSDMFQENTYIVALDSSNDCVVIDPGLEPERIIEALGSASLTPDAILVTHGHADHIAGIGALKSQWPKCRIVVGVHDAEKLIDPEKNLSAPFGFPLTAPPADTTVADGQSFEAAGINWETREIPGHSQGHVVFVAASGEERIAFVGDVIFAGSVGRTDLPGGSFSQLSDGIRRKIYTLPDETRLYSGHGPVTTVGHEKATNRFVREEGEA